VRLPFPSARAALSAAAFSLALALTGPAAFP
jgi:hypothetical protein